MTIDTSAREPLSLPPLTRRGFLSGVGAASMVALATQLGTAAPSFATSEGTVLPLVDPLPDGAPDRTLFAPNEQVFAAYLMILAPLANSVIDDDPERYGWMEDGWQRLPNEPFNARIMEHVATLSWFYAHERAWNPYYLDANLLGRLDAALQFYVNLQHEDGSWPEYRWEEHGLAPTGFGTVALSAALRDLTATDALPERRAAIEATIRLSSAWLVDTSHAHWSLPINVANQVTAGLAGVAQTSAVLDDPDIAASLAERCALLLEHGQAPAGFFNEPKAYDYGYNFEVMMPDLGHIYEQTGDPSVVELARRWADWGRFVILPEPGQGAKGFHVGSFSARNASSQWAPRAEDDLDRSALGRVFLTEVPELSPFYAPAEEKVARRQEWAASPDPVQPRAKQNSSARLYMHVPNAPDGVPQAQRDAYLAQFPHLAHANFTELRLGTLEQQYALVRRPACYSASLYGVRGSNRQRTGTGAFWHPEAGTFVLALNNATRDYWGTITATGAESAREDVTVTHHEGSDATGTEIAPESLTGYEGVFTSRYATAADAIVTEVSFWQDGLRRTVVAAGAAEETIPLMLGPDDEVVFSDGTVAPFNTTTTATATGLSVTRGGTQLVVTWTTPIAVELATTDRSYLDDTRRHHVLTIPFTDGVTTEFTTVDLSEVGGERVGFAVTSQTVRRGNKHHTAVHVINLEDVAIDVRIASSAGRHTFRALAPGASGHVEFRNDRLFTAPGVAVATTCGDDRPRVATRRFTL